MALKIYPTGHDRVKCKGKLEFETSASQSAMADLKEASADWDGCLKSHPAIAEWLSDSKGALSASLIAAGTKYGSLTEGQERAANACIASDQGGKGGDTAC